jgi:citrate synthase
MTEARKGPTTHIATSTTEDVFVRGKSLTKELIGKVTFTEMTFLQITGKMPTRAQTAVLDACLVTLMEHGLTPSVIVTRLVAGSAPEAMQAAVAAGLLGVGSVFVGTVEGCAALLMRVAVEGPIAAVEIVEQHRAERRPVPGFGHPLHKPDDPRPAAILAVADAHGATGKHVEALRALSRALDASSGKHVTINATGAVAAALGDCGLPPSIMRGFAVISRCAGLVGHLHEDRSDPTLRAIWEAVERAVPFDDG